MEKGWRVVYFTDQEYRAIIAKELLEDNQIDAVIINRKDSSYTSFGEVELYVADEKFEEAEKILQSFKTGKN